MIQFILFFIGCVLISYSRVMFAKHNAVFYYKGRKKGSNPIIEEWKNNIHIIANEAYRTLFGAFFCFCLVFTLPLFGLMAIPYSLLLVILTSAIASYDWQRWINLGVGLPAIDPNEKQSYELTLGKKKWIIPKFWYGKRRLIISWCSLFGLISIMVYLFNNL